MVNTPMIRAAGPDDLGAVADLLTDAFLPDPIMSVIVAAAPDPRAALDHLHRIELASHYLSEDEAVRASARVDAAVDGSGRLLGVTLWDAPGTDGEAHDVAGPLGLAGVLPPGLDLGLLGGAWELCLLNNRTCEAHRPPTPHWYLYMIAVAPGARGTGTGAALLRRGLERVDAQGTVAHLEATTRRAASFYGRHGFVDSAILNSEGRLPDYWAMTRPKRRQH